MFQNLRPNSQLYILHKDNTPYIEYGSVVSVSAPKPKYPAIPQIGQFPQMEMVVDVVVNVGGQTSNLQGLPAGAEIADFGQNANIVVSSSRDAMNNEVAMMRQKSTDILNSTDYHRNVISACDKMLNTLNPELAAKQQQDAEMKSMREQMNAVMKSVNTLAEQNRQLMEQLGINETSSKNRK